MPVIELKTFIRAPREIVFDLSRSVDAHLETARATAERVVSGRAAGLVQAGDEITWEARHLGIRQRLSSRITVVERPDRFEDEMIRGAFRSMSHRHEFFDHSGGTLVRDRFCFESPLGILGRAANRLIVTRHMQRFLEHRNAELKRLAESGEWERFLR